MNRRKLLTLSAASLLASPAILRATPAKSAALYVETKQLIDGAVPVTDGGSTQWRWVHRLALPPLFAGDILQVKASGEFRNDNGVNTEFATQISLTPGWPYYIEDLYGYGGASGYADFISAPKGENVDANRHYRASDIGGDYLIPQSLPSHWLHFRVRCRSTSSAPNYNTIMGPGYGKLSCVIHRN